MNWTLIIIQCLAAIVASVCYPKYKHKPVRMVLLLLWIAVVAEIAGRVYTAVGFDNNHWIYNVYSLLFYGLFYKMVYDHIQNLTRKKIVATTAIIMFLVIGYRAFTTPFLTRYMVHVFNIATFVMVLHLMYYAIDLLKSNANFKLKHNLEVFIFGGYLLFSVSFIPLAPFIFGIWLPDMSRSIYTLFSDIQGVIIIIMNLIFIYGFLWTKEQH